MLTCKSKNRGGNNKNQISKRYSTYSMNRTLISNKLILARLFVVAFATNCAAVFSQDQIEEVVVEAEKGDNAILDELASVTAIDGEKLADAGIENVEDVSAYVPNLVLTQSVTGTNIFIRGIGSGVNQGFDQSVGLYSDGVPLPRANMARAPFLDLAGIQVVRGPQYVLDGNYSIAGSVHMLSNLSTDEFKAGFDFNYQPGQRDSTLLLTAGGPISEKFAMNVVLQRKQADGYVENVFKGDDESARDELTTRFVLGYTPTDDLSFKLKAERGSFDTTGRPIEILFSEASDRLDVIAENDIGLEIIRQANRSCPVSNGIVNDAACQPVTGNFRASPWITETDYRLAPRDPRYQQALLVENPVTGVLEPTEEFLFAGNEYFQQWADIYSNNGARIPPGLLDTELNFERATDTDETSENDSLNFTLTGELQAGEFSFTSTSSYIEYEFDESIDGDLTPLPLIAIDQSEQYDQVFQSFKFESPRDAFLEVSGGLSYLRSKLSFQDNINLLIDSRDVPAGGSIGDFDPMMPLGSYFEQFAPSVTQGFADFGVVRNFEQTSTVQAAYLQTTFNWLDNFRTTVGARYTHSKKEAFKELYLTDKDFQDFDLVVDPNLSGRESRTPDLSADQLDSMRTATADFLTLFGLQTHTNRYDIPGTGLDQEALDEERREEQFLPSITFEWDVLPDLTLLASARKANKLGGFDARSNTRPDVPGGRGAPVGTFEFRDEDATVYELGAKWFFPGGNGQLSATAFFTEYTNLQTSRSDGKVGANVTNAGGAETRGVEVDGFIALSERFNISYSLAWIDFEFTDFITGGCSLNERPDNVVILFDAGGFAPGGAATGSVTPIVYEDVVRPQNSGGTAVSIQGSQTLSVPLPDGVVAFDALEFGAPVFCDFKGRTNQFVAEYQGTFAFNYASNISDRFVLNSTLDVLYNSGYITDVSQDADVAQGEYAQFNARLELADPDDIWTLALTAENLTDERIISSAAPTPIANGISFQRSYFGFVRPPRTLGLNVRYYFF